MSRRWILDDAERALLAALNAQGIGPSEAAGVERAFAAAAQTHGFEPDRMKAAVLSLASKGLVEPLGDRRLRLSNVGYLASQEASEALRAGIIPF